MGDPSQHRAPQATGVPPSRRGAPSRLLAACCWLYLAGVLALWGLLRWADVWWPATFLMFSPRLVFALPAAALLPAALLARRPSLLPPLALAGLVAAGPLAGGRVPWGRLLGGAGGGAPLRVMTCNMHSRVADPGLLEGLVERAGPDVVALQEWNAQNYSELLAGPGWHTHRTPRLFLASRFPIRHAETLGANSYGMRGSVGRYELETPAGLVTLFSLHLASPRDALAEEVHEEERGPADIRGNTALRWLQSRLVAGQAAQARAPVVLVGDFNTPVESAIFREAWRGYADTFDSAGWGWGYTFYGGRTAVRIDHVLAGAGWRCRRCWVGPWVGSPHRPVVADLVWQGEPGGDP